MKTILTTIAVSQLTGVFLYPLLYSGLGRPVSWFWEGFMAVSGVLCFYLLVKFRRQL